MQIIIGGNNDDDNNNKNNVKTYRDLQQEATLIDCHRLAKEKEKEERRVTWGIPKVFTSHDEYDEANLASGAVDGILVLPPPGADVKRKPLYLVANMEDHGDPEALADVLVAHSRKEGRGVVNVKKQSHCPTHTHTHTHTHRSSLKQQQQMYHLALHANLQQSK